MTAQGLSPLVITVFADTYLVSKLTGYFLEAFANFRTQ